MANVSHASLTGSELHEPKGAASAAAGTVYVANGAGSGTWSSVGTSAFTGAVADFLALSAPSGWLELDGSTISTTTYSALYGVMSMTTSGTRSNGSPVITSIPDTSNLRAGYYAFGTGVASGTTILSVDSATQVTLSANSSSAGSGTIVFSPWLLNTGTIQLPDLKTAGRYRRSRSASNKIGDLLADQNKAHTHVVSGNSSSEGAHTHTFSGVTGTESATHTHGVTAAFVVGGNPGITGSAIAGVSNQNLNTGAESTPHTHGYSGTTSAGTGHVHAISLTSASDGGTETRPLSIVLLTCVKT